MLKFVLCWNFGPKLAYKVSSLIGWNACLILFLGSVNQVSLLADSPAVAPGNFLAVAVLLAAVWLVMEKSLGIGIGRRGLVDSVESEGWKLAMSLRRLCDKWLWKFKFKMERGKNLAGWCCASFSLGLAAVFSEVRGLCAVDHVTDEPCSRWRQTGCPFWIGHPGPCWHTVLWPTGNPMAGIQWEDLLAFVIKWMGDQKWTNLESYQLQLSQWIVVRRPPDMALSRLLISGADRPGHVETNISRSGRSKNLLVMGQFQRSSTFSWTGGVCKDLSVDEICEKPFADFLKLHNVIGHEILWPRLKTSIWRSF